MAITALNTALMASGVALVAHGVKKKDWDWLVIGAGVVFGLGGLAQATGHERASIFRTDWPPRLSRPQMSQPQQPQMPSVGYDYHGYY
jgi:hypothetical protein